MGEKTSSIYGPATSVLVHNYLQRRVARVSVRFKEKVPPVVLMLRKREHFKIQNIHSICQRMLKHEMVFSL